jgi:radical SAM protein with 4Fe4S-binding SPASM domain
MFELSYPLNIQVEVTGSCNHRCFYCYNGWQQGGRPKMMRSAVAQRLGDIIPTDVRPFHTTITGGEPLLNMEAVCAIASALRARGLFYNLNTNLTLLTEDRLDTLRRTSSHGRFGILSSLPHFRSEEYASITGRDNIKSFYSGLRLALASELPVTVNMVVHQLNIGSIYDEARFLVDEFGVKSFAATPAILPAFGHGSDYGLSVQDIVHVLETLLRVHDDLGVTVDSLETIPRCLMPERLRENSLGLFKRACSAGRSTLSIDYRGLVRACSHAPIRVGSLLDDGFEEVWRRLAPFRKNEFVPSSCDGCGEFYACYGGCRFFDYAEGQEMSVPDPRMTGPTPPRPAHPQPLPELDSTVSYAVNHNTLWREERDGLFVLFNGSFANLMFVNSDFKEVVAMLMARGPFTIQQLPGRPHQWESMLRVLLDRRFVQPCQQIP